MTRSSDDLEGGFVVTPRDIYDEVRAVRQIVEPLPGRVADLEKGREDHEGRIRTLERVAGRLAGIKGVLALCLTASGGAVVAHLLR